MKLSDLAFIDRLSVQVPPELRDAVRLAADRRGVTVADFVRGAVGERLARDGRPVRFPLEIGHIIGRTRGRAR